MKTACKKKQRIKSYLRCMKVSKKKSKKRVSRRQDWNINEILTPTGRTRY